MMRIVEGIRRNFWAAAVGFLAWAVPFSAEYLVQKDQQVADAALLAKQLSAPRVEQILAASTDFQTLATAYISAVMEQPYMVAEQRERLIASVMQQYANLDVYKRGFPAQVYEKAEAYQSSLAQMSSVLPTSSSILEMRPFWEAASDVLVARNAFISELERLAG